MGDLPLIIRDDSSNVCEHIQYIHVNRRGGEIDLQCLT
jgi:hypothetical protein